MISLCEVFLTSSSGLQYTVIDDIKSRLNNRAIGTEHKKHVVCGRYNPFVHANSTELMQQRSLFCIPIIYLKKYTKLTWSKGNTNIMF